MMIDKIKLALICILFAAPIFANAATIYSDQFPTDDATRYTQSGERFWNEGDYVEQEYINTGLTSVNSLSLSLLIGPNSLLADTQDMFISLNGSIIGNFSISSGDTMLSLLFNGFSVLGTGGGNDNYILRLETSRTVISGEGSAGILNGGELVLTSVPIPAAIWLFSSALIGLFGLNRSRLKA